MPSTSSWTNSNNHQCCTCPVSKTLRVSATASPSGCPVSDEWDALTLLSIHSQQLSTRAEKSCQAELSFASGDASYVVKGTKTRHRLTSEKQPEYFVTWQCRIHHQRSMPLVFTVRIANITFCTSLPALPLRSLSLTVETLTPCIWSQQPHRISGDCIGTCSSFDKFAASAGADDRRRRRRRAYD